jgi:hypothetical protein
VLLGCKGCIPKSVAVSKSSVAPVLSFPKRRQEPVDVLIERTIAGEHENFISLATGVLPVSSVLRLERSPGRVLRSYKLFDWYLWYTQPILPWEPLNTHTILRYSLPYFIADTYTILRYYYPDNHDIPLKYPAFTLQSNITTSRSGPLSVCARDDFATSSPCSRTLLRHLSSPFITTELTVYRDPLSNSNLFCQRDFEACSVAVSQGFGRWSLEGRQRMNRLTQLVCQAIAAFSYHG